MSIVKIECPQRGELTLNSLAEGINSEHHEVEQAVRSGYAHAVRCGELLIEAKRQCDHGQWLPWLEQNFEGTPRMAQGYMKIFERRGEIEAKAKHVSHLTIREALRLTARPKNKADAFSGLCDNIDADFLDCIPELSPNVITIGFESVNYDNYVELHPSPDHAGYYYLVVYRGLLGDDDEAFVEYLRKPCNFDRELLAYMLYMIGVKPMLWTSKPATGEYPWPVEKDAKSGRKGSAYE